MSNPLLASVMIPASKGYRAHEFRVEGGLHFIAGNKAPYFTLTYSTPWAGGAGHAEILACFPQFADLAALHLSDIDGVPMHAVENGWYNLAGALPDGFGTEYHRGNADLTMPDGYRKPTGDECLQFFADHCRITLAEARKIRQSVVTRAMNAPHSRNAIAKAKLAEIMATMRPRWKAEADACIAKHGLKVYGDPWPTT